MIKIICIFFLSLILSILSNFLLINLQRKKHLYQPLQDELKSLHQNKKHTPIFGGVAIYLGILFTNLIFNREIFNLYNHYFIYISIFFFIGLIDDLFKIFKKNNYGLKGIYRFILELIIAMFFLKNNGYHLSFLQNINVFNLKISLSLMTIIIFLFVIVGGINGMNLTDGLDALASSIYIIGLMPFIIYAFKNKEYVYGHFLISSFSSVMGFIVFNINPSKIFLGDGGSLLLGSIVSLYSVIINQIMILFLDYILIVIESLSVIVQVISYKCIKKRIFLMAPIHHHFELKGINENKICLIAILITYFSSFLSLIYLL